MPPHNRDADSRRTAIDIHQKGAHEFARLYGACDPFMSAFRYGRRQMEIHFDEVVCHLSPGAQVLDIGFGTGEQMADLMSKGFCVQGIEPSSEMRRLASDRIPESVMVDATVLEMPFADNSFDFVYALEVFRYLERDDNLRGLTEIKRVLRSGGVFFGTFVNRFSLDLFWPVVLARRLASNLGLHRLRCHTEFETPASLAAMLEEGGFEAIEVRGACFAPVRLLYKLSVGQRAARWIDAVDRRLTDANVVTKYLSGHLIGVAVKP